MEEQEDDTQRRKILGLLVLLAIVGMVVAFVPSSVMAASFTISDTNITTENGQIDTLTADASGEITWDGAENPPGSTDIELQVQNEDGTWTTIASDNVELSGLYGSQSYSFSDADVLSSNWKKNDFSANGDGSQNVQDLTFRLNVETGDLDGDGTSNTFQSSDDATITVDNEPNSNSAGGSGNTNAGGPQGSP